MRRNPDSLFIFVVLYMFSTCEPLCTSQSAFCFFCLQLLPDLTSPLAICLLSAVSGNFEVGVHIADVSYFIVEGTALDEVASKRATSVYLVQKVRPKRMPLSKIQTGEIHLWPRPLAAGRQGRCQLSWFHR